MENNHLSSLATERVGKLMGRYAVPCIISLLVGALYNIVDQIFIANADYLGSFGNAANTVVFPLTVIALAIAVMIGDGCCAYVSQCLGVGRTDDAHKSVGSAVLLCVISSSVLMAVYLLFADPILKGTFIYLQALGKAVLSTVISLTREIVFGVFLPIVMPMFMGLDGILRSFPAADVLTAVISAVIVVSTYRQLGSERA